MRPRPSRNRTTGAGAPYPPITINLPALYLHLICPTLPVRAKAPSRRLVHRNRFAPRAHRSISAATAAWAALRVRITRNVWEAALRDPRVAGLSGVQAAPEQVVLYVLNPPVRSAEPSMELAIWPPPIWLSTRSDVPDEIINSE